MPKTRKKTSRPGNEYVLVDLGGVSFNVVSWGPDRVEGTEDDISLRRSRRRR